MNELKQLSSMINRREFMQASAGSLALAALGCTERPSTDRDSTITVAFFDSEMIDLFSDQSSMYLVFLALVARNAYGELEGRLAEGWEHSPDFRTWTVHLRQGVRWHDGVPVTAHDVKFTLDLLSSPEWLHAQPGGFTVTVLDDSTYTIEYHHLLADQIGKGSPLDDYTVYYPRHLLQQFDREDFDSWESWFSHPVGNGPYRFVRHEPRIMMEFEANPDFYRGKPSIERVVLKLADHLTELLSGSVDVLSSARGQDLLTLSGDDRFQAYHSSSAGRNRVIAWNLRNELFRDASVRRALTLAIDRTELYQVLNMPAGLPIFDAPLSDGQYRRGEVPDPLPYDPEQARQLLHEAGWRDGDGGGVRERDGRPFRFTLLTPSGWPMQGGEPVYIQSQLRRVGITVEVQTMDWAVVTRRVTENQFDAALSIANASLDSPRGVLSFFGEESVIGYANRDVIALLEELKGTIHPDEVDRIYRQLARFVGADLPVTYLYPDTRSSVATQRVRGLSAPYRIDALMYMDELWLEGESE
jgi:peptide/nickel transport system substrate-binding protein